MSNLDLFGAWAGSIFVGGMLLVTGITMSIHNWFTLRNRDK